MLGCRTHSCSFLWMCWWYCAPSSSHCQTNALKIPLQVNQGWRGDTCHLFLSPTLRATAMQNKTCVCFCGNHLACTQQSEKKKKNGEKNGASLINCDMNSGKIQTAVSATREASVSGGSEPAKIHCSACQDARWPPALQL